MLKVKKRFLNLVSELKITPIKNAQGNEQSRAIWRMNE